MGGFLPWAYTVDISTDWERGSRVFFYLVQDSFLSQHVLEPIRGKNVLDIVLSSQKEFVDNVKISELWGVVITTTNMLS